MSLAWTSSLLVVSTVLAAYCLWHQRRPRELGEVTLFPATLLLGVALILIVVSLAHLITLLTGISLPGRGMGA